MGCLKRDQLGSTIGVRVGPSIPPLWGSPDRARTNARDMAFARPIGQPRGYWRSEMQAAAPEILASEVSVAGARVWAQWAVATN